jgi:Flp pilus assembly protein CpaB
MAAKRSAKVITILGLAVFLVVAAVAMLALRGNGSSNNGSSAASGSVPVLVAKKTIAAGTQGDALTGGDLYEVKQVPQLSRLSDALTSPTDLANKSAIAAIGAGQQLRTGEFRSLTLRNGAFKIPDGMQAVAVTVPYTPAVAGYVGPGDHINLYGLFKIVNGSVGTGAQPGSSAGASPTPPSGGFDPRGPQDATKLILSNVQVLDVSQEIAPVTAQPVVANATSTSRATGESPITYLLALNADQAEKVVFFTTYDSLYLTLVPEGQPLSTTNGRSQADALRP